MKYFDAYDYTAHNSERCKKQQEPISPNKTQPPMPGETPQASAVTYTMQATIALQT